jgi:hypothetical protein
MNSRLDRRWFRAVALCLAPLVVLTEVGAERGVVEPTGAVGGRAHVEDLTQNARRSSPAQDLVRRSPQKRAVLGEVITVGDGIVRLNGAPIFWGSAVFDESDIETTSSMAFVRLSDGGGVVYIGPMSRVRLARSSSGLRLRLLYGEATIRSREDIEVEGPERFLRVGPSHDPHVPRAAGEILYSIFVRDQTIVVQPLSEGARRDRVWQGVAPEVASAIALMPFPQRGESERVGYSPGPMSVLDTTERPPLVIGCRAEKLFGQGLRVVGRVALGTTPIGGAPVIIRVLFRNRLPGLTVMNVVTGADGPFLGYYQAVCAATPADLAAGGVVEVVTHVGREIAGNRCGF